MKKQIIIAISAVLIILTACFAGGKYYMFGLENNEKIQSFELPPFSDDIVLYEGETVYENYFEVISERGFSSKDIGFVSENKSIAEVKYSLTDRNRYVCYKVKANSAGETYIYFTVNSGETVSEKIKVVVLPKVTETLSTEAEDFSYEPAEDISYEEDVTQTPESSPEVQTTAHTEESTAEKSTEKAAEPQGNTVYISPTGKRYHYSKSCAGKNAKAVSKAEAQESGKTPCKKCAGG